MNHQPPLPTWLVLTMILLCFLSVPVMMSMWLMLGVKSIRPSYS